MEFTFLRLSVLWVYLNQMMLPVSMIEITTGNMFVRKGIRLTPSVTMIEINTRSKIRCMDTCLSKSTCLSSSWCEQDGSCRLSNKPTTDESTYEPKPGNTDFEADCITISRITKPIFHALGVHGRYTMMFTEARDRCVSLGASLASPADMLEARELGYEFCSCGWMADGSKGYVLQAPESCKSAYSDGITYCGWATLADAYCKFKIWG